jgi:hypothetical protein
MGKKSEITQSMTFYEIFDKPSSKDSRSYTTKISEKLSYPRGA